MNDISRRNFMKGLAGVVAGVSTLSKAEEPKKAIDAADAVWPEPRFLDLESVHINKEYDLIADLVEEMKEFDKKFPEQAVTYFIHCNYTGLAFLNDTGLLDSEKSCIYYWGYEHCLYVIDTKAELSRKISVRVTPKVTESDLNLIGRTTDKCSYTDKRHFYINADIHTHRYRYELVTTRCFNVNREEEGKIIAGLERGQRFCRANQLRSFPPNPANNQVFFFEDEVWVYKANPYGIDGWVDFYKT